MILLIWAREIFCNSFTPLKSHLANLLRHKPHHEYDYGGGKHKGTHVGKAALHTNCFSGL